MLFPEIMSQRIRYSSDLKFYSLDLNLVADDCFYNLIKNTSILNVFSQVGDIFVSEW